MICVFLLREKLFSQVWIVVTVEITPNKCMMGLLFYNMYQNNVWKTLLYLNNTTYDLSNHCLHSCVGAVKSLKTDICNIKDNPI